MQQDWANTCASLLDASQISNQSAIHLQTGDNVRLQDRVPQLLKRLSSLLKPVSAGIAENKELLPHIAGNLSSIAHFQADLLYQTYALEVCQCKRK